MKLSMTQQFNSAHLNSSSHSCPCQGLCLNLWLVHLATFSLAGSHGRGQLPHSLEEVKPTLLTPTTPGSPRLELGHRSQRAQRGALAQGGRSSQKPLSISWDIIEPNCRKELSGNLVFCLQKPFLMSLWPHPLGPL